MVFWSAHCRWLSVVGLLELGGWDVAECAVEAFGVEPVDPLQGGQLDLVDVAPRASPADQLGLVETVDRLGERIVVGVRDAADRRSGADLVEAFGVANRRVLGPGVGVAHESFEGVPRDQRAISIESRTMSVRMFDATRHPTIVRENTSVMNDT